MSLQRKFAVLLTVLALAVLASLGTALWSIGFLESLAGPWGEIQQVQNGLNRLKRGSAEQVHLWAPGFPLERGGPGTADPEQSREAFTSAGTVIRDTMVSLEQIDAFRVRVGASNAANLRRRVGRAQELGRGWLQQPNEATAAAATAEYFDLHELIEKIENAIIAHAYFEADFGRRIRPYLLVVLGASLLGTVLAGVLGVVLVRRWVVKPVRVLRDAAERLGKGDFSHRVPVEGTDELGRLSGEVNHMAGMISALQDERVDRERLAAVGEMVRRLVHNLRNPLAGIRSLAELTRAELPGGSPGLENQDRIVSTIDRFERWLSDLLSVTTPLKITVQACEVPAWVSGVIEPFRAVGAEKGVQLQVRVSEAPSHASFDPRHLEQAIVAVLVNAIQASPRGQPVVVSAERCEDGQAWEIRVADRGPGVDATLREKIFRPYFTTKRDGTGIGLAVAKQVVEQHGGRIWVESGLERVSGGGKANDSGSGAVFVMWLPLASDGEKEHNLARSGQIGEISGQDTDRRGRGEPAVFNPADAAAGRA